MASSVEESEGGRSLSPTTPPPGRHLHLSLLVSHLSLSSYGEAATYSLQRGADQQSGDGLQEEHPAKLCKRLNLTDKQIRNWFQNRRMRMKRMVQDALAQACQAKVTSHLLHYTELQAYRPGPNPTYHPHHAGAEGGASTPYLHNQYSSSMAGPALPSLPATPMDSLYQYVSLPGLVMPTPRSNPLMGAYQPHSHLC
ncbi:ventrally expressed dharma/bozozok antagonist [Oncorhynchus mykiss]|uniref:ventrally expressed dharma/bozozok antagonist n=1 Tax=Oncorhynchus mykiss TaxID=8022 RepID=UPI001878650F|nr:ventrally expressed dharma/bozozok antagonist [Oncorhynchus mykiss]